MNTDNANEKSQKKQKHAPVRSVLTLAVFVLITVGAFVLNIVVPKPAVLQSERRKPAAFPKFSVNALMSNEFMDGFDKYASDNFVFRDNLRTIRAISIFDVFMQTDKSGLYYDSVTGAGEFKKVNETSFEKTAEKIKNLCGLFPELDIYYAIIPDKTVYTKTKYPGYDHEKAREILAEQLGDINFIDLKDVLNGTEFYLTDIHWDQSKIIGVLDVLGNIMGFSDRLDKNFKTNIAGKFHGIYTGQLALPLSPDTMTYLTSDILDNAIVSYYDPKTDGLKPDVMYDKNAVNGRDPYDVFLKGVQPIITIENPSATTARQLYLFRDSFGSSLAPLLTSAYAKITVIDVRYIHSLVLERYITFAKEDADVLFLYSSQILNNPSILQVD